MIKFSIKFSKKLSIFENQKIAPHYRIASGAYMGLYSTTDTKGFRNHRVHGLTRKDSHGRNVMQVRSATGRRGVSAKLTKEKALSMAEVKFFPPTDI